MRFPSLVALFPLLAAALSSVAGCGAGVAPSAEGADVAPMPPPPTSCASGPESVQRHGTACLCCHSDEFGVAGSVDPSGPAVSRVVITGADGDVADMVPNSFANFFRHFPLAPPLRAVIYGADGRSITMRELAPSGDCNACHGPSGTAPPLAGP